MTIPETDLLVCVYDDNSRIRSGGLCLWCKQICWFVFMMTVPETDLLVCVYDVFMVMIPEADLVVGVYDVNRSVGLCLQWQFQKQICWFVFLMMIPEADLLVCVYDVFMMLIPEADLVVGVYDVNRSVVKCLWWVPETDLLVCVLDADSRSRSGGWCLWCKQICWFVFMMMVPEADLFICLYDDDSKSRSVGLCLWSQFQKQICWFVFLMMTYYLGHACSSNRPVFTTTATNWATSISEIDLSACVLSQPPTNWGILDSRKRPAGLCLSHWPTNSATGTVTVTPKLKHTWQKYNCWPPTIAVTYLWSQGWGIPDSSYRTADLHLSQWPTDGHKVGHAGFLK